MLALTVRSDSCVPSAASRRGGGTQGALAAEGRGWFTGRVIGVGGLKGKEEKPAFICCRESYTGNGIQ